MYVCICAIYYFILRAHGITEVASNSFVSKINEDDSYISFIKLEQFSKIPCWYNFTNYLDDLTYLRGNPLGLYNLYFWPNMSPVWTKTLNYKIPKFPSHSYFHTCSCRGIPSPPLYPHTMYPPFKIQLKPQYHVNYFTALSPKISFFF